MAQKKHSNGDRIACPYCGAKGTAAYSYDDLLVVHKTEWRELPGRNGGTIRAEVWVDGCSRFGKITAPPIQPVLDNEEF